MSIFIPISRSDRFVEISVSDLPPVDDLIGVLAREIAPLSVWLKLAVAYRKQGRNADYENLLTSVNYFFFFFFFFFFAY
jgi:hypothetical protein